MSRIVIGLDCGSILVLNHGAELEAIMRRVNERINESSHDLMDFVSDNGDRWSVNAGAINFVRETDEYS